MTIAQPRSRSSDRRIYGVVEAIVAKVTDDPEQEGRVKLTYPWFDGGREVSDWCRVSQLYAGNGYGSCFVPEEGDEVLVAFIHGDMRFPIILGGLYNGKDKPPTARTTSTDQKMIRTKAGHRLIMDDSPQSQAIRIVTQGGHELILDDQSGSIVASGNGVSITLKDDGSVTVQADTVTVQATTVDVQASQINLGAGASLAAVLGPELVALFDAHFHTLTPPLPPLPTTPPTVPLPPTVLSTVVKLI
jgi:uncharacterized protein involved in type VI secretion and phage assembly